MNGPDRRVDCLDEKNRVKKARLRAYFGRKSGADNSYNSTCVGPTPDNLLHRFQEKAEVKTEQEHFHQAGCQNIDE